MSRFELDQRRDRFAAAALTGLLAAPDTAEWDFETMASRCVLQADALIAALDKAKPAESAPDLLHTLTMIYGLLGVVSDPEETLREIAALAKPAIDRATRGQP